MIFIDSNVPMYLVGPQHALKAETQHLLSNLVSQGKRMVSNAEVLQEILHRYVAVNRREAIQPAFDALLRIADEIIPIDQAAAVRAKEIVTGYHGVSARDALHLATMERHGIMEIFSFDSGFDQFPGIARIPRGR